MPLPTVIADLNTTASLNYPAGTDSPAVLDDVQRAHASFIAQLRDANTGTNTGDNATNTQYSGLAASKANAGPLASSGITGAAASGANTDITSLGAVTGVTAAAADATTKLATTAFVGSEIASKAPTKTGGGASGTWGINITGNAATASNAGVTSVNGLTGAVTVASTTTTAQVGAAYSGLASLAIGSYIIAIPGGTGINGNFVRGNTYAGTASDQITDGIGTPWGVGTGASLAGTTWRLMSMMYPNSGTDRSLLMMRVS